MKRLMMFGLFHDILLEGTKTESVFQQLLAFVTTQTSENIHWGLQPGTKTPGVNCGNYTKSPFVILSNGKVSKDKGHHPLHLLHCSTYDITTPKLIKTLSKNPHLFQRTCNFIAMCAYHILTLCVHETVTYWSPFKALVGKAPHP
jgi:hypothetical protein